ncbi:unnamed protein product [Prunus armeniaca]
MKSRVHVDLTYDNEIRSLITSRMKRHSTLNVTLGDQLKVKRRTIIQTRKTLSQQNQSHDEEAEVLAVHHVTIKELDEEEPFEDEVHDAPAALEYGGQAIVDELKELNLGTNEDLRPIFVRDARPQSKSCGPSPCSQAWNASNQTNSTRFRLELLGQIEAKVDKLIAARFIREVKYPTWIANIVLVKKKIITR